MINTTANLQKKPFCLRTHKRVAGTLPNDGNIEFIGIPSTKEVIWFQFGNQHSFSCLPAKYYKLLEARLLSDKQAMKDIVKMSYDAIRQVELYTYYVYGDADFTPDIINEVLQPAENYRHDLDCISLGWFTKELTINGEPLNNRDILICDMMVQNYTDKLMAHNLNISLPTFDFHKRNLYHKAGVDNKCALLLKIINERI